MKKNTFIPFLLLNLLTISLFSSCSKETKIHIKKINNLDSFIFINELDLQDLLKHKEDFVLVIGEDGCSTCDYIKTPFVNYIKKYETIIYWIEYPSYQEAAKNEEYKLNSNLLSSSVLIIDDGNIKKQIDYDAKIYFDKDKLDYTLSKYVNTKGIYDINKYDIYKYNEEINMYKQDLTSKEKLDNLINSDEKVSILYSWKECGDCKEFKENFLNEFLLTYKGKLYEYEVDAIRSKRNADGSYNLDDFTIFATEKEFDSYLKGKVPTIVTYENGKKIDMIVYSNDIIEENNNQYIVKNSFYPSLINKENKDKLALHNELINEEIKQIKNYLNKYAK